jgi:ABC-type branched-subunit amino acid transport system ATPase component
MCASACSANSAHRFHFWKSEKSLDRLNGRAMELLEAVDLAPFAKTVTVELPYGRKRALEIATTLALDPELMLLDEPTQGMGHEDVGRVVDLIRKVSANRTILMVEHNLNVVADLSDTITVLARGAVLAEGPYAGGVEESAGAGSLCRQRTAIATLPRKCCGSPTCMPSMVSRIFCTGWISW